MTDAFGGIPPSDEKAPSAGDAPGAESQALGQDRQEDSAPSGEEKKAISSLTDVPAIREYALIAGWAKEFVGKEGNAVRAGDTAPATARKKALIEDSRSAEEMLVIGLAEAAREKAEADERQVALVEAEVVAWLKQRTGQGWRASIVRGWAKKGGLFVTEDRMKVRGQRTYVLGARPVAESWPEVEPYAVHPADLEAM